MEQPLVTIVGATGTGKSKVCFDLLSFSSFAWFFILTMQMGLACSRSRDAFQR